MEDRITTHSLRQFWAEVAGQQHAMAGAVIAASAAQSVALATACMRISLAGSAGQHQAGSRVERMVEIRDSLAGWCDRDAAAIAEFVALREAGQELQGQQLLCDAPAAMGRLVLEAAETVQQFRPLVVEQVRDDLEMSLRLLAGVAQAALLLLDSNLRIWPEPALLARYEPVIAELAAGIDHLSPLARVRQTKP